MNMIWTYWNNKGDYQHIADSLSKLVPVMGPSKSFAGELWRSACNIYYDLHNNGFGNCWKGHAMYLVDHVPFDGDICLMFEEFGAGNCVSRDSRAMGKVNSIAERMMNQVIEHIVSLGYEVAVQHPANVDSADYTSSMFVDFHEFEDDEICQYDFE